MTANMGAGPMLVRKLSKEVRVGLDLARAFAAIYVVAHHAVKLPRPFDMLLSFGQEAVIVFFLLSGFVIFANESERVRQPRGYYLRRVRRLYPTFLFAMLVSTILWLLGLIEADFHLSDLLGTVASVQDISFLKPGVIAEPYLGNDPLWSLSYEVLFYLMFPGVMYFWRKSERVTRWCISVVCVGSYVVYLAFPNHFSLVFSYFIIWWAGAMLARLHQGLALRASSAVPEICGLSTFVLVTAVGLIFYVPGSVGVFPILMVRHSGVALLLFLLAFTSMRKLLWQFALRFERPVTFVASISYGLYVLHYPILVQIQVNEALWFVPLVGLTVFLAWFGDRILPRLIPSAPRS
ncbi:hypothetical protein GCM10028789_13970 [Sinomonas halotolerans]